MSKLRHRFVAMFGWAEKEVDWSGVCFSRHVALFLKTYLNLQTFSYGYILYTCYNW
jgi:hypothetical protein